MSSDTMLSHHSCLSELDYALYAQYTQCSQIIKQDF